MIDFAQGDAGGRSAHLHALIDKVVGQWNMAASKKYVLRWRR
jgi:hypothetical protein